MKLGNKEYLANREIGENWKFKIWKIRDTGKEEIRIYVILAKGGIKVKLWDLGKQEILGIYQI